MNFESSADDELEFQHVAGCNIIKHPPIFSPNGQHIFFVHDTSVHIYSTVSCQLIRKLVDATSPIVNFELELKNGDILVACTQKGSMYRWNWQTGELKDFITLKCLEGDIRNFNLLNLFGKGDLCHGFVSFISKIGVIKLQVIERTEGDAIPVNCSLKLESTEQLLVVVDTKNYPNLIICQGFYIFFVNYTTWYFKRFRNPLNVPITAVQIHPTDECVATGDEWGKIFLWRHFYNQQTLVTTLYHWHHTMVSSIAFTPYGSGFYSSGYEAVLVKWYIDEPFKKHFLPRMVARIRHIIVNNDNTQIAISTMDNGVQLVGTEKRIRANLQEFTYIPNDKTNKPRYPVGLRLNPRTNCLVLNGRTGSLQFYNTYTNNLLYNLQVTNENLLSMERSYILYDTQVIKAAFNIDWMATGEVFNDEEHLPELRLKFWQYCEEKQTYALNTTIELPHEGSFKAIAFSSDYHVDDLLCVTAGDDNIIKMWSLEKSDNMYKKSKTWFCIATTIYKQLHLTSLSFSQDGSLLAVGYGNTLCIYKAHNMELKVTLTAPPGLDGCLAKAQIKIPTKNLNGAKSDIIQKVEKVTKMFQHMLETNEETLINELKKKENVKSVEENDNSKILASTNTFYLDEKNKISLFKQILHMSQLNLYQKILLWQKLNITCRIPHQMYNKFIQYINKTIHPSYIDAEIEILYKQLFTLNYKERFNATYRFQKFYKQKCCYNENANKNLLTLEEILNIPYGRQPKTTAMTIEKPPMKHNTKSITNNKVHKPGTVVEITKPETAICYNSNDNVKFPPLPSLSDIIHVQFASGEHAHLIVVCTAHRILVWNLLTLRLQSCLKLSAEHVTFDPLTNLMAVVTKNNELYVFQPNAPVCMYQRNDMPKLFGLVWVPRRYPKQCSINIDWQAQSTLYFLNAEQEILTLRSPNDKSDDVVPVAFENVATPMVRYTTFGTYAVKSNLDTAILNRQQISGPLILSNSDKAVVKELLDMSTHTMPPMSLLSDNFVKSMLKKVDINKEKKELHVTDTIYMNDNNYDKINLHTQHLNGDIEMNGHSHVNDNDDDSDNHNEESGESEVTEDRLKADEQQQKQKSKYRQKLFMKTEKLKQEQHQQYNDATSQSCRTLRDKEMETKLRLLSQYQTNFEF